MNGQYYKKKKGVLVLRTFEKVWSNSFQKGLFFQQTGRKESFQWNKFSVCCFLTLSLSLSLTAHFYKLYYVLCTINVLWSCCHTLWNKVNTSYAVTDVWAHIFMSWKMLNMNFTKPDNIQTLYIFVSVLTFQGRELTVQTKIPGIHHIRVLELCRIS